MRIKGDRAWLKHFDFMIVDLLALVIAFAVSFWLKFHNFSFVNSDTWKRLLVILSMLNVIISIVVNPYSGIFRRSYYQEIIHALRLTIYNMLAASIIFYVFKIGALYSREMFLVMHAIYFVLSLVMKYIWKKLILTKKIVLHRARQLSLFIIGQQSNIRAVVRDACAGDFELYHIAGIHLVDGGAEDRLDGIPVIPGDFVDEILRMNVDEVLVAVPPSAVDSKCYERIAANGIGLSFSIESTVGFHPEEQVVASVGIYNTLSVGSFAFSQRQALYLVLKRLMDIAFGLVGVILLIPISAAVKVACLASGDTAKIFYRQRRIGLHGREINIFKFRSMVPNAEEILQEMLKEEHYRREWEENQKFADDPRITRVGKVLRRTSIDELPQLINVLLGDMSLVGPRPLVRDELESHNGLRLYQKVKPGITGWWSCNGRSNIEYNERLELEYYYVKNCSLYLDALCVLRTIVAVIRMDGAQ